MVKIITFFSHKGGVGKTTTAHNVGVALTKLGKNVLLIDADAQMNLTSSVLGLSDSVEYAEINESKWVDIRRNYTNINDYLNWYTTKDLQQNKFNINLFDYNPKNLYPDLFRKNQRGLLTLLLGDVEIFNLETKLYSIITNKSLKDDATIFNIQQGIKELSNYNGKKYDFILIDTSPSASSILNGIFVMMSDYFLCPVLPNFFSLQAIDNITEIMKNWINSLDDFRKTTNKKGLDFQPKFLGIIINMAKRFKKEDKSERQTTIYAEKWREKINNSIDKFYKYAIDNDRILKKDEFKKLFSKSNPFIISEVCDFTGQIRSISEITGIPVVDLSNEIIKAGCTNSPMSPFTITKVRKSTKEDHYNRAFQELTESYNYIAECLSKL
jgi:chromosome partitioning protein